MFKILVTRVFLKTIFIILLTFEATIFHINQLNKNKKINIFIRM